MLKKKLITNKIPNIHYIAKSIIGNIKINKKSYILPIVLIILTTIIGTVLIKKIFYKPSLSNSTDKNAENIYQNSELKFKFTHGPTTKIYSEEKSYGGQNNRQLSVVMEDSSLVVNQIKDDQLYFVVEVWKSSAPYVGKICKSGQKIQLKNLSAVQNIYTDNYKRFHRNTCIEKNGNTYLLMTSVSTKYNNQPKVEQLSQIILDSFVFY